MAQSLKHLPAMRETQVWSLSWEDPLEKEMATHSSILAWRIPWKEKPGRLQSTGSQRVAHDWATSFSFYQRKHTCIHITSADRTWPPNNSGPHPWSDCPGKSWAPWRSPQWVSLCVLVGKGKKRRARTVYWPLSYILLPLVSLKTI